MQRHFLLIAGVLGILALILISLGGRVTGGEATVTPYPINPIFQTATCGANENCVIAGKTQAAIYRLTYAPTIAQQETEIELTRIQRQTAIELSQEAQQTYVVAATKVEAGTATARYEMNLAPLPSELREGTAFAQATSAAYPSHRARWDALGSQNYQMTIDSFVSLLPRIGLELTIRDGEIVYYSILACDKPSLDYPESNCELTRENLNDSVLVTVEELFDHAEICTANTQNILSACPAFDAATFEGFKTYAEMYNMAYDCAAYLKDAGALCSVDYDRYYGYPRGIWYYAMFLADTISYFTVLDLRVQ